jgi:alanine racemase
MQQVRPTTAHVDLGALAANFATIRAAVPAPTGVLCAVKGDAYGHGAVECALALEAAGADWFGVALVEEGRLLRQAGVTRPILSMGGVGADGADVAIHHRLTPVISDLDDALRIEAAAARRREPYGVHLKVDTGMGRLGVPLPHWEGFLDRLAALRWVRVDGIASHFAESDDQDEASRIFTREQGRRFLGAVLAARSRGLRPALLHLANSGAILEHPRFAFDLVRPGLLVYGYSPVGPTPTLPVRPVLSVSTRVLLVRDLPSGVGVSYGRTWSTSRPSRIATLPVGYADGYPRALSNRAEVLIHGHRAPLRGRVCMDLCMIDVTDVPVPVRAGDEVVLLGAQGGERITAWDLAGWAGTIPYEVLAGFSARVPRRFASEPSVADRA